MVMVDNLGRYYLPGILSENCSLEWVKITASLERHTGVESLYVVRDDAGCLTFLSRPVSSRTKAIGHKTFGVL